MIKSARAEQETTCGHFNRTFSHRSSVGDPLFVTENGWPTGPNRSKERQAEVLQSIVETVFANREQFKILGYNWFALRDADSANADLFHQFGLLDSDYIQKPAFHGFKELIRELQVS